MPDETGTNSSGLGSPAKRGRPRKQPIAGASDGDPKPEGREPESKPRIETIDRVDAVPVIDPFTLPSDGGADTSGSESRKRRKYAKRAKEEEAVQNLSSLLKIEQILVSGAFFLGNIANAPEFHMSEAQSQEIGEALREIAKLYPVGISEKTIAWINLSFAVGGWAGPAMVAVARRPKRLGPGKVQNLKPSVNGAPAPPVGPPLASPETAAVPSQMWPEAGDIGDED